MSFGDGNYYLECHYISCNTFGRYLRSERVGRGILRSHLARTTEIPETRLAKLEANAAAPTYAEIRKLSLALGLSPESLLAAAGYVRKQQGT